MRVLGVEINRGDRHDRVMEVLADYERMAEDIGWIRVNDGNQESHQAAQASYEEMVKRSRLAFIKNPIVAQAVSLMTTYTFGEGINEPKCKEGNDEVQDIVKEFWTHPDNKISFTAAQAQSKISNKLQYDGELAITFKVDTDGSVYVRFVDPLSIQDVIKDPSDGIRPLFYKRKLRQKDQYIPDYANALAHLRDTREYKDLWDQMLLDCNIREDQVPESTFIYHVKINNDILDKRGIPEIYRALDWMNANAKINQDMALFINTQAQFAWKKKFKGTKAQMQSFRAKTGQNNALTNPARGAGSVLFENEKVANEAVALPNSSGELFEVGIRRTLLMTIAAFGMMEHYFGDPSTGNLATSTTMELPMLKRFLARQKLWEDVYVDVLNFQLDMRLLATSYKFFEFNPMTNRITVRPERDYEDRFIDVDFPPILEKDLKMLSEALGTAKEKQLVPTETAQRTFLQGLGVNNVDEEMKKEFAEPPAPAIGGFGAFNRDGAPAREAGRSQERLARAGKLAEKNKEVFRKMNGYLRAIGGEYKALIREMKAAATTAVGGDEKWAGQIRGIDAMLQRFENGMLRAAERYLPQAARLGRTYVEARLSIKEGRHVRLVERQDEDTFIEEQIAWNRRYVKQLAPAIGAKVRENVLGGKFNSQKDFMDEIDNTAAALEARVAMYAGAFWTVEERAVKTAAQGQDVRANFVGVDDGKTCEGCAQAIEGSPWPIDEAPVPGEQECLGNCRHALQLVGDEALTESDIDLMRDSEKKAGILFSEATRAAA